MRRLYTVFDYLLPPFVLAFTCWGCFLALLVRWPSRRSYTQILDFQVVGATILLDRVIRDYVSLCAFPRSGDSSPPSPPHAISSKTSPFECKDHEGNVSYCNKDQCHHRWKAPRSHHCSTCGTCKLEWDHHCPWIGNCVSKSQALRFLRLLSLTPITILFMALPTFHIQWDHAVAALRASQADEWTLKNWWHWPGSWIVFGGPVGRYVTGIVYGYRILQRAVLPDETGRKWQDLIMKPCLSVLGTVVFALLLAGFSLTLAVQMAVNTSRGQTTLDIMKWRSASKSARSNSPTRTSTNHIPGTSFVWIPRYVLDENVLPEGFTGAAVASLPGERLYDHGWRKNWSQLWNSDSVLPPGELDERWQLNPLVVLRMKKDILKSF